MTRTEISVAREAMSRNGNLSSPANTLRVGNAESPADIEQMTCILELINPAKAERMLKGGATNRSISSGHSARQARAMIATEWRVSSQGIGVDYNGHVIDGQHRLRAIITTGVSIWIWVMRGLYPDTIRTIDDNRKRTFADDLKISGVEKYAGRAAFTNLVLRFEQAASKGLNLGVARTIALNRTEAARHLEECEGRQDLDHLLVMGRRINSRAGIPTSAASAAQYLALEHKVSGSGDESIIEEFFEKLSTGFNITARDPVGALLNSARVRQSSGKSLDPTESCAAILYCLEKTLAGGQIKALQWTAVKRRKPEDLLS